MEQWVVLVIGFVLLVLEATCTLSGGVVVEW